MKIKMKFKIHTILYNVDRIWGGLQITRRRNEMEVSACSIKAHHEGKQKREKLSGFGKVASSEKTNEKSDTGAFIRQQNRFDTPFGNNEGDLPVEAGRYRLLWTPICPWATRQVIVLKLLGIDESVISIGTANPIRTQKG